MGSRKGDAMPEIIDNGIKKVPSSARSKTNSISSRSSNNFGNRKQSISHGN